MAFVDIDGIRTRYEVSGSGPPLLLFSPGGFNAVVEHWSGLGVYAKVPNRETNGYPMWKHVDADLCIACAKIDGNDGWVVAQYTTWHDDRQHKCMQLEGAAPPWSSKNSNTCTRAQQLAHHQPARHQPARHQLARHQPARSSVC